MSPDQVVYDFVEADRAIPILVEVFKYARHLFTLLDEEHLTYDVSEHDCLEFESHRLD